MDRWEDAGADIVNHGINDVLVQGATPLFFLDTVAAQHLDPEIVGRIVDGMVAACQQSNCILLGGETAEMPGVFTDGAVDIAGTMVGAVGRAQLLPKAGIEPGHALIGVASSGLHTNGYSLARKVAESYELTDPLPGGDGISIGDALCAPHRSYHGVLAKVLDQDLLLAMAHITGGGMQDNLPRVLPDGVGATVDVSAWERPPLFQWLIDGADLTIDDAHQIFNCGVGMVLVVRPDDVAAVQAAIAEPTWVNGETVAHDGSADRVKLVNG
jgi:phosphoribosylaminoimidazole synthetase